MSLIDLADILMCIKFDVMPYVDVAMDFIWLFILLFYCCGTIVVSSVAEYTLRKMEPEAAILVAPYVLSYCLFWPFMIAGYEIKKLARRMGY